MIPDISTTVGDLICHLSDCCDWLESLQRDLRPNSTSYERVGQKVDAARRAIQTAKASREEYERHR